jgi:3-oxoacyl-[acyl-carrier protein] reductase
MNDMAHKYQLFMKSTLTPPWTEQIAIITGGADGLGAALAKRLVGLGVNVAVLDFDSAKLENIKRELKLAQVHQVDVTDPAAVRQVVDGIAGREGRIDILVNCAGITGKTNILSHEVELADFDRVMKINLSGTLITAQSVLPHMLARNYGRILNIASISGKDGNAGMLAYSTSKAAVIGLTKVMGKEYAQTGVTINALAPAVIRTAMVEKMPEAQVLYMTDKIPMKRCGTMEEFAATAAWIVSPENSFSTGFTYDLSGGRAVY